MDFDGASEGWEFEILKLGNGLVLNCDFESCFFFPKIPCIFLLGSSEHASFQCSLWKNLVWVRSCSRLCPASPAFCPIPPSAFIPALGLGWDFDLFSKILYLFENLIFSGKRRLSAWLASDLLSSNRRQTNSRSGSERRFQRVSGKVWLDSGQIQEAYQNLRLKRLLYPTFYLWWYHVNAICYHFFAIIHSSGLSRSSQK